MNSEATMVDLLQIHSAPPPGMAFHYSPESIREDENLVGYWSVLDRAFEVIQIDGALFLDGRPILYLKKKDRELTSRDRRHYQKLFWNQGVANVLVLADPSAVYIYSGLAQPVQSDGEEQAEDKTLVQELTLEDYARQAQDMFRALATGYYYEKHRAKFDRDQAVDSRLLTNLGALRDKLISGEEQLAPEVAHAFIGRILFLCYLIDRKIVFIDGEDGTTGGIKLSRALSGLDDRQRREYLYGLFGKLKEQFNGNMFDQDLETEKDLIGNVHLGILVDFLGGHEVESGQRVLNFWPYDFKMIPVETISAIYQDFLKTEDQDKQKNRGAFYTPRFLAEMVVDTALQNEKEACGWSYLDPACGSGIFLVILFNRLANWWLRGQPLDLEYKTKAEGLQAILRNQISGVELEETACRITCFSLYLAYLDFFTPPDIKAYMTKTGQKLPKLLDYGPDQNKPLPDIPVIHRADFIQDQPLAGRAFDCLIGNPPWEGRGKKQIALRFLEKAPLSLRKGGLGCLLLPSKTLHNQTDSFQAEWLRRVTLDQVLQLADYRRLIFQNAICPAVIARFRNEPPKTEDHQIRFASPKFNRDGLRKGVINVNPASRTWISLAELLATTRTKTAPLVWKRRLWGSQRDQRFLDLLQSMPPLGDVAGAPSEDKRWVKGQGLKPWPIDKTESDSDPDPIPIEWSLDTPFVQTKNWESDLLLLPDDTVELGKRLKDRNYRTDVFYAQPSEKLFTPPMVLISQGFSKVAFSDMNVLFQHSLQSISGPSDDAGLLRFLTVYFRSKLANYFLFHTSANWGTERDKVHLNELLRVPFPLPGSEFVSPDAAEIINQVAAKFNRLRDRLKAVRSELQADANAGSLVMPDDADFERVWRKKWRIERKKEVDALQGELEPLIYRYFDLTEQEIMLVEDTVGVFEPSSTPGSWRSENIYTLDPLEAARPEPYSQLGLRAYADTLTGTLNSWARGEGSKLRVCAEGGTDQTTGLAMVTIRLAPKEQQFITKTLSNQLSGILAGLYEEAAISKGPIADERDVFLFSGNLIHIVRPDLLLNWTRTAALNDAARIYGDIALASEVGR